MTGDKSAEGQPVGVLSFSTRQGDRSRGSPHRSVTTLKGSAGRDKCIELEQVDRIAGDQPIFVELVVVANGAVHQDQTVMLHRAVKACECGLVFVSTFPALCVGSCQLSDLLVVVMSFMH